MTYNGLPLYHSSRDQLELLIGVKIIVINPLFTEIKSIFQVALEQW